MTAIAAAIFAGSLVGAGTFLVWKRPSDDFGYLMILAGAFVWVMS